MFEFSLRYCWDLFWNSGGDYCGLFLRRNIWTIGDRKSPFAPHEISLLSRNNDWCMWDEDVIFLEEISEKQVVLISSLSLLSIKSHCCWEATIEILLRSFFWNFRGDIYEITVIFLKRNIWEVEDFKSSFAVHKISLLSRSSNWDIKIFWL